MAKVLISFLGTGPKNREYRRANYKIDNKVYKTSFISAALAAHLNVDKKIIIGTAKSMWEEYYKYFSQANDSFDENFYFEIYYSIDQTSFSEENTFIKQIENKLDGISIVQIKYGLNEDELRFNLNKIIQIEELLEKGDEVYIDVTHGFRSFPLLAQHAINYLKLISDKDISVKGYYYGMLEAIGDLGYAPIVDLSILNEMNELIIGASEFKNNSNGIVISKLLSVKSPKIAKKIENFSKAISINYSHETKTQINQLRKIDFNEIPAPERFIIEKVFSEFLLKFKEIKVESDFQFKLSEWYFKNNLYGASYIFLTEAIISKTVETLNINKNTYNKDARDKAKTKISTINKELAIIYNSVNKIRKNIAHALNSRHDTYLNDINNLEKYLKKTSRIFKQIK